MTKKDDKTEKKEKVTSPEMNSMEALTIDDVIEKARGKGFKTSRDRQAEVELATLQVLVEIRDAVRK